MRVKKAAYFLIHNDTGQRYPIKGPVVIGRNRGDIVFSSDNLLSAQHCLVEPQPKGLDVRDLRSVTGTKINGVPVSSEKVQILRTGQVLSTGEQSFTLQTVTRSPRIRKRSKPETGGGLGPFLFVAIVAVIGSYFAWQKFVVEKNAQQQSQLQLAPRPLAEIFENYQNLQMSIERQTAAPLSIADRIHERVLAPLNTLSRRYTQAPAKPGDIIAYGIQLKFIAALSGHARAQVQYLRNGGTRHVDDLDQLHDQLAQSVNEMRALQGPQFPSMMQSPLQQVEREVRQALRDYRQLGSRFQNHQISDRDMSEMIQNRMVPSMIAVRSRLGAIKPQTDLERRKLALEGKLLNAVIAQLKSMSLYAISKDPKYARELEHWGKEIEKTNTDLKQQMLPGRVPAAEEVNPRAPAQPSN